MVAVYNPIDASPILSAEEISLSETEQEHVSIEPKKVERTVSKSSNKLLPEKVPI